MSRGWSAISGAVTLTCAVASAACSSSSSGGGGGFIGTGGQAGGGGEGGQGGVESAMLRVAHMATDVPSATATEVDFFIVGEGSFNSIGFGRVTLYATVPAGPQVVEVRTLGGGGVLATASGDFEPGSRHTFVAYRDAAEATEMRLMEFDEDVSGLDPTQGRLWVGHGVDDASWSIVHVVRVDENEVPLAQLELGEQTPPIDLDEGPHGLGFDIAAPSPTIDYGPFTIAVEGGEPLILFAVDQDTTDLSALAEVFRIGPDTSGAIDPLPVP